ncbi:MAG: hypothetical protein ACYC9M_06200 [Desulfobulbaceae bacterium]
MDSYNPSELVQVVDAVMGTGKSTWAIGEINGNLDKKYVIVTPLVSEVTRYKEGISKEYKGKRDDVVALDEEESQTKSSRFKQALQDGKTIIATHKLFTDHTDEECFNLIGKGVYNLILDETITLVKEEFSITEHDVKLLISSGYLTSKPSGVEGMDMLSCTDKCTDYNGAHEDFFNATRSYRVFRINNQNTVIFVVPPYWIAAFYCVHILTYLFEGSETHAWLQLHNIRFDHSKLIRDHSGYRFEKHDLNYSGKHFKSMLTIFVDKKMNAIGEPKAKGNVQRPLSHSWFDSQRKTYKKGDGGAYDTLRKNVLNYFKNRMKARSSDVLWTCPKGHRKNMRDRYFDPAGIKTWVASPTRATNDFRDRHVLAFLLNVYQKPNIVKFFQHHGITLNAEIYALSTLVQWTWRSAIREGEPITIYLPSERMRNLLKRWLAS